MSFPILRSLEDDERRQVLASTRRRRFARREVLFHEGDPGDTLHFIDKGRVAVRIATPAGDVATVDVLGRGDVVGIFAVLEDGGRRAASVVALEATETLSIDRQQFLRLRQDHPAINQFVIDVLANQVRRVDTLLMEALYSSVEARVVRRLMALAEIYRPGGAAADTGVETEICLTQEDLASLAGTSRATANRVLRELEDLGAVSLARNRIRVVDPGLLAKRSR